MRLFNPIGCARNPRARGSILALAVAGASMGIAGPPAAHAAAPQLGDVFVIDLENHNWTQTDGNVAAFNTVTGAATGGTTSVGGIQQIFANPAAPYINSLINPSNANSAQVSYTNTYFNVLATPTGNNPSIHPSEPNYLWQESGTNFGIANDNDPYATAGVPTGGNVAIINSYLTANATVSGQSFTGLLQSAGVSWKSYQEDTDLGTTGVTEINGNQAAYNGHLTGNALVSTPVSPSQYTVPLASFSGTSTNYTNPYNGSHQYNFAAKHDGTLFYSSTSGGNDPTTANALAAHYAPMQALTSDLASNTVGRYNLITPDQYNDMHTGLTGGFQYNASLNGSQSAGFFAASNGSAHFTGDAAQIAQGDNFLAQVVPLIMSSQAYKNNGAIVIWTDETEPDSLTSGTNPADLNQNDYQHTLAEIVISPLAKGNGYDSSALVTITSGIATGVTDLSKVYTHSSDVKTLQEIFHVPANTSTGFLSDAGTAGTNDLSDLFVTGTIPTSVPEPASLSVIAIGTIGLLARRRRRAN